MQGLFTMTKADNVHVSLPLVYAPYIVT